MKRKKRRTFFLIVFSAFVVSIQVLGQTSARSVPEAAAITESTALYAGASEVDITPGPGLPLFGYSVMAAGRAKGYWTRLKARTIVFKNDDQRRIALVQLDLGAVSGLLHENVCRRLADRGFRPEDILICASHTHAGPGGFFGNLLYNAFGSGRIGYFRQLVDWLAARIAQGVIAATEDLAPARVAYGEETLAGFSRNRSLEAWMWNFSPALDKFDYPGVIPTIGLLRVDHVDPQDLNHSLPIAAFAIVPVHATAVSYRNELYHGDLLGVASRLFAAGLQSQAATDRRFIAALGVGPQGDVSPNWTDQGYGEAVRLGELISAKLQELHASLKNELAPLPIYSVLRKCPLPGAMTVKGALCMQPMPGIPVMGGAEDGRSNFYGKFGIYEGRKGHSGGCQQEKVLPIKGRLLLRIMKNLHIVPEIAPLQIIRIGDLVTFAALPVEATTETGRRLRGDLKNLAGSRFASVIAMANEYISYTATEEEYRAQHYEGAMTLYGPWQSLYFREQFRSMLSGSVTNEIERPLKPGFNFGKSRKAFSALAEMAEANWRILRQTSVQRVNGRLEASLEYFGPGKDEVYRRLPRVQIMQDGKPLRGIRGMLEDDEGVDFQIAWLGKRRWLVKWLPPTDWWGSAGKYQIAIQRASAGPLVSEPFALAGNLGERSE